jgi:small subunit ribosomal protein S16
MIKIRLSRGGVKNAPFYRIIAIEKTRKREGKPLDILGFWHPAKNTKKIERKKIDEWVKKGAQITKAVQKLLKEK